MKEKTKTSKLKNVNNLQMTFQISVTGEEEKVG